MRQGIGVVLVLILMIIGAGFFVVTAVSLRSSVNTSAATLSVHPNVNSAAVGMSESADQTQPMESSATLSGDDTESGNITFSRSEHQGFCDGDKSAASSAGY